MAIPLQPKQKRSTWGARPAWRLVLQLAFAACFVQCHEADAPAPSSPSTARVGQEARPAADAPPAPEPATAPDRRPAGKDADAKRFWTEHAGQCVRLQGYRGGAKIGPRLIAGDYSVGVALADPRGDAAWFELPSGAHVEVEGQVAERADLPVFIPKKGEPVMQGMPVPEGTDLDAARRRFVVDKAHVRVVRGPKQAARALGDQLGQQVRLAGVVWSLNGHWWFSHNGVEVHLADHESASGWSPELHGRIVTLHGRLDRAMLPRIDQIAVKTNRDRALAFRVHVESISPHPEWLPEPCGP